MLRVEIVLIVLEIFGILGDEFGHLFEDKPNLNLNQFEINCKRLSLILILTEILNLLVTGSFNLLVTGIFNLISSKIFNLILSEIFHLILNDSFNLILTYSVFLCGNNFAMIMYWYNRIIRRFFRTDNIRLSRRAREGWFVGLLEMKIVMLIERLFLYSREFMFTGELYIDCRGCVLTGKLFFHR
jgi:hypothetical protein